MTGTTYTWTVAAPTRLYRELRTALRGKVAFTALTGVNLATWALHSGMVWGIFYAFGVLAAVFVVVVDLRRASQLTKVLEAVGSDR